MRGLKRSVPAVTDLAPSELLTENIPDYVQRSAKKENPQVTVIPAGNAGIQNTGIVTYRPSHRWVYIRVAWAPAIPAGVTTLGKFIVSTSAEACG